MHENRNYTIKRITVPLQDKQARVTELSQIFLTG